MFTKEGAVTRVIPLIEKIRYYPDYGISIAFQINTDIGIVDNLTPSIREMEIRLAEIVISGNGGINIMK